MEKKQTALLKFIYCLLGIAAATLCAASASAQVLDQPGQSAVQVGVDLRDLAPVRLYAVPQVESAQPVPLPDVPPTDAGDTAVALGDVDSIPDIPYELILGLSEASTPYRFTGLRSAGGLRESGNGYGGLGLHKPWLPRPATDPWTFGTQNWRYAGDGGLDVTLGNDDIAAPVWGNTARLGGVSVSQTSRVDANDAGSWQYSLAVGALDYSSTQGQGDLTYGPTASSTVIRYGLSRQLTLESQLEVAPELVTTGLGGQYHTQGWGVWSAGIARANRSMHQGWRYQTAYQVNVMDDLQLSWVSERHGAGYADLSRYRDQDDNAGGVRQQWSATVPLGRWGDLSGSYENARSFAGTTQHNLGLTQQFWYSPNLRVGVTAQRETVSGDYDIALRFSVPIY